MKYGCVQESGHHSEWVDKKHTEAIVKDIHSFIKTPLSYLTYLKELEKKHAEGIKEKIKERNRKYYEANKDCFKKYREANKDYFKKHSKKYHEVNKEIINLKRRLKRKQRRLQTA